MSPKLPILVLSKADLDYSKRHRQQHLGSTHWRTWDGFCRELSNAMYVDSGLEVEEAKAMRGGFTPGLFNNSHRAIADCQWMWGLSIDLDGDAPTPIVADWLGTMRCVVYDTYRAHCDGGRSRFVMMLDRKVTAAEYKLLHGVIGGRCSEAGFKLDAGAKDASRLSYLPVRPKGMGYSFRVCEGDLLNVDAELSAIPKPVVAPIRYVKADKSADYNDRALACAVNNLLGAAKGNRHAVLRDEAYTLARLPGIDMRKVEDELYSAAVTSMGKARADSEARRTIQGAMAARRTA